jgi:hypothetical protein
MGKVHNIGGFNSIATPGAEAGCCPFAHSIHSQNGSLLERAGEKGAGGVRFMMFGENVAAFVFVVQGLVHFSRQVELMVQP